MSELEGSWKCEKHGMTWDIGCPCAMCHDELEAEVKWLKERVRLTEAQFAHRTQMWEKAEAARDKYKWMAEHRPLLSAVKTAYIGERDATTMAILNRAWERRNEGD